MAKKPNIFYAVQSTVRTHKSQQPSTFHTGTAAAYQGEQSYHRATNNDHNAGTFVQVTASDSSHITGTIVGCQRPHTQAYGQTTANLGTH